MGDFWCIKMEKEEIWWRYPPDIPKNGKNQGRIHRISMIGRKCTKTLALSCYPLWNLLDDKQVVLSTWIICRRLVEKPLKNFQAETSPKFLPKFQVEMRG